MKIARLKNKGELELKGEIKEYPERLKGTRNHFILKHSTDSQAEIDRSAYLNEGKIYINSSSGYGGLRIPLSDLSSGSYVMQFKFKKVSGTLLNFGGHIDLGTSQHNVYLDGVPTGKRFTETININDDFTIHEGKIEMDIPNNLSETAVISLQPNRGRFTQATVEYSDITIFKANENGEWKPSPEDLGFDLYPNIGFDKEGNLYVDELTEHINTNLITNGNFEKTPEVWNNAIVEIENNICKVTRNTNARNYGVVTGRDANLKANTDYTLSFEVRSTDCSRYNYCYIMSRGGNVGLSSYINFNTPTDYQWHRISISFQLADDRQDAGVMVGSTIGESFDVKNIKLELGTQSTRYIHMDTNKLIVSEIIENALL